MPAPVLKAVGCALLGLALLTAAAPLSSLDRRARQLLLAEVGDGAGVHRTTHCNASVLGSAAACRNASIPLNTTQDFPFGKSPYTTYPRDGTPWGIHITGPYPDGTTYLVSWQSHAPLTGPPEELASFTTRTGADKIQPPAKARLSTARGSAKTGREFSGRSLRYTREYRRGSRQRNHSYLSPAISHVLLTGLPPATSFFYVVGDGITWSAEHRFTTLGTGPAQPRYPLRIGLLGDTGQTNNSTTTQHRILANRPQVVLHAGDLSYADNYGANDLDNPLNAGNGTNQNRWDTMAVMWEPLFSSVPVLSTIGNHEIESGGINATLSSETTSFAFPSNYPFQSYASRYPAPGTTRDELGSITRSLYYSTNIGGAVKLITLNNYVPFHKGTPQWEWAQRELRGTDRSVTPWLLVMLHLPPYHTYVAHYKEAECFMSVWEKEFYRYGVDMVISGHVHAYERTHPVHRYRIDTCAPVYLTLGDGGNVEGPYRQFVDERVPGSNRTYCEHLRSEVSHRTPNELHAAGGGGWGPVYQLQVHPPGCPTLSWQAASGVGGGPVLNVLNTTAHSAEPLGFCQSSQPVWSAYRDPSFGHGMLELLTDDVLKLSWYRNIDGEGDAADEVTLERLRGCAMHRQKTLKEGDAALQTEPSVTSSAAMVGATRVRRLRKPRGG